MSGEVARRWQSLTDAANGRVRFGAVGVRDPDYPCEAYDARGYQGAGPCMSDGHYECANCSQLSPEAPRFTQDREGRVMRLRWFWARPRSWPALTPEQLL